MRMTLQKRSPAEPLSRVSSFAFCNDEQAAGHEDFSSDQEEEGAAKNPATDKTQCKDSYSRAFQSGNLGLVLYLDLSQLSVRAFDFFLAGGGQPVSGGTWRLHPHDGAPA